VIRIVEILVAVNAIAGIATFLGARYVMRKLFWRKVGREDLIEPESLQLKSLPNPNQEDHSRKT